MQWRPLIGSLMVMTLLALAGCGTAPTLSAGGAVKLSKPAASPVQLPPAGSGRGGYYQDDGPGANPPPGLAQVPDAEVKNEPYFARNSKPYVVFGSTITPITDQQPFLQHGLASWYGKKFHGQRTASGERYDMYKMTAAHPTLPIPSYVRVTSMASGKQVIVRVNDRGPFHSKRIIDVSYTAALQLGLLEKGSNEVQVERLLAPEIERIRAARFDASAAVPASVKPEQELKTELTPQLTMSVIAKLDEEVRAQGELGQTSMSTPGLLLKDELDSGFYLQLGSFAHAENAQSLRASLTSWAESGKPLQVLSKDAKYRVFSGPFSSRAEAGEAAATIPAGFKLKPLIVQR